ncbi:MAG TPA: dicarboxylate/amino acid:cation symporter [Candidatus Megaira endosymbiont of Hartmannula sinica]|nr:dicarboxylate/amino acid:cation symporter [Candidatus Megaera endosymbiont of Hartmannula sinica]
MVEVVWRRVLIGIVLGVIFGITTPTLELYFNILTGLNINIIDIISPIGKIFLHLIKMVIVPLIFFSLISGLTSMKDPNSLGRVGMKSVIAYMCTTFFAVLFGLGFASILQPGKINNIDQKNRLIEKLGANQDIKTTAFNLAEFIIDIVPKNIFQAFSEGRLLQVVFFAIFCGYIINNMGEEVSYIRKFVDSAAKLVLKMISKIILLSPLGAFALTYGVVATQGFEAIMLLLTLSKAVIIAMLFQYMMFGIMIMVFCRMSPIPFFIKSFRYQILALSTGSSKASLATTMKVCNEGLGVSESSISFVLPLGASINMDGFAINLSLTTIFFTQLLGVELGFGDYMVIILTSTLGSMGGAGIPGASLIMLPMVLSSINIPIDTTAAVGLIAAIDRVLDLVRAAINITGDATITVIIDHSEGNLDKEKYYNYDNEY